MFISDKSFVRGVLTAAAALLAMVLIPELSQAADDPDDAKSIAVQYQPADLAKPAGVAELYRRIRRAAGEVCNPLESASLDGQQEWKDCYSHAVANAVHKVHNDALSAYHLRRIRGWKQPADEPISLAAK